MAAITLAAANTTPGLQWQGADKVSVVEVVVDLASRVSPAPTAGYSTGDVLTIARFQTGQYVLYGAYQVIRAEGAAATMTLASTGTAFAFVTAGADINTAGNAVAMNVTSGLFLAASALVLTLGGTLNGAGNAKVAFRFVVANVQ